MIKVKFEPKLTNFVGVYSSLDDLKNAIIDSYLDYYNDYCDNVDITYDDIEVDDNELREKLKETIKKYLFEGTYLFKIFNFNKHKLMHYFAEDVDMSLINEYSKNISNSYVISFYKDNIDNYTDKDLLMLFSAIIC